MQKQTETKTFAVAYKEAIAHMIDDWAHPYTTEKKPVFSTSRKGKITDES